MINGGDMLCLVSIGFLYGGMLKGTHPVKFNRRNTKLTRQSFVPFFQHCLDALKSTCHHAHMIIDPHNYLWYLQWNWRPKTDRWGTWLQRTEDGKTVYLHRAVWERTHGAIAQGMVIDHKNHDGTDNRLCNLRLATVAQNGWNSRPRKGGTSIYKGVCWEASKQRWRAKIRYHGKHIYLGRFKNELAAARELFGEFAFLNFP